MNKSLQRALYYFLISESYLQNVSSHFTWPISAEASTDIWILPLKDLCSFSPNQVTLAIHPYNPYKCYLPLNTLVTTMIFLRSKPPIVQVKTINSTLQSGSPQMSWYGPTQAPAGPTCVHIVLPLPPYPGILLLPVSFLLLLTLTGMSPCPTHTSTNYTFQSLTHYSLCKEGSQASACIRTTWTAAGRTPPPKFLIQQVWNGTWNMHF